MIAALYVARGGVYWDLPGVDAWDQERDARLYDGPWPVVAHPPCERWGRYATGAPFRKDQVTGDDGGCFLAAVVAVRRFGGVLEHPAHSIAWAWHGLPKPSNRGGWSGSIEGGWSCHVEQGHYGHPGRKATWLYAVGRRPPDLIWGPAEQRLPAARLAGKGYEKARRCGVVGNMSAAQRKRTPIAFRDVLLSIAAAARP